MQFDITTIEAYCKCLSSTPDEIWTFWLKQESDSGAAGSSGGPVPGFGCFSCPISDLEARVKEASAFEWSLHTTLNITDLDKRRTENIRGVRCLCVDLDRVLSADEIRNVADEYSPDMVVQSSPGKYHLYWKVAPTVKLGVWVKYQLGLAAKLGGDLNMSQLAHTIRVPGCERRLKDGSLYLPEIMRLVDNVPMRTDAGIRASWPWILEAAAAGELRRHEAMSARAKAASAAATAGSGVGLGATFAEGSRNCALYDAVNAWVYREHVDDEDAAVGFGLDLNRGTDLPLAESEVISTSRSAFRNAEANWRAEVHEMSTLLPDALAAGSNGNGNGVHGDAAVAAVPAASVAAASSVTPKAKKEKTVLPAALKDAAAGLVSYVWSLPHGKEDNQRKAAVRLIAASLKSTAYVVLAEEITGWWEHIGHIDCKGVSVSVRERSAWGSEVLGCEMLSRDVFIPFLAEVLSRLIGRGIRLGILGSKQKLPGWGRLRQCGEAVYGLMMLNEKRRRQAGDKIVMQNGVLWMERCELHGGCAADAWVLEPNPASDPYRSAREYSHAVDARFVFDRTEGLPILERDCPVFCRFLQDWMPGDRVGWDLVLRWFGYSMTTDNSRQKFMWLEGPSGSGKGSLCGILGAIVGKRNRCSINYSALDGDFEEAAMYDKLTIAIQEATGTLGEHRARLERLKKLVSHEEVAIKRKYRDPMQDIIVGKIVIQSNEAPIFPDSGGALRHRMVAVGLEHSFRAACPRVSPMDQVIAAGECDALATLAAVAWAEARRIDGDPFKVGLEGAQVLSMGEEAIIGQMNVVNEVCQKYLTVTRDSHVSNSAVIDLIRMVMLARGLEPPAKHGAVKLLRDVSGCFDKRVSVCQFGKRGKGARQRGFRGLEFNKSAIIAEYPELQEELAAYPALAAELGFQVEGSALDQWPHS